MAITSALLCRYIKQDCYLAIKEIHCYKWSIFNMIVNKNERKIFISQKHFIIFRHCTNLSNQNNSNNIYLVIFRNCSGAEYRYKRLSNLRFLFYDILLVFTVLISSQKKRRFIWIMNKYLSPLARLEAIE